jgi:hypothetical protein
LAATPVSTSVDGGVFRLLLVPSPSCALHSTPTRQIPVSARHSTQVI